MITEKELMRQVIQLARMCGWMVYHTFDSRRSAAGFPDLVLVRERTIFVELKTDKGLTTPDQDEWIERLKAAKQEVYVWRPKDWGLIEKVLG